MTDGDPKQPSGNEQQEKPKEPPPPADERGTSFKDGWDKNKHK